jgi:methionyl-tRNA formyltransferase
MYALASNRPWNRTLCRRLTARTAQTFVMIERPEDLDIEKLRVDHINTIFFPHWSYKIPAPVYDTFECIIFHMTDVPYGRGGSPLQNLITRKHEETVITALRCVKELDAGPVYLKRPLNLNGSAEEIFLRADRIIESMIVELVANKPTPTSQQGKATVFRRRQPEQGDWSAVTDLDAVFDHIRMLDAEGYPSAFVDVGRFRLHFRRAARRTAAVDADVRITLRDAGEPDS